MPKYYVRDGKETAIIDADSPLNACVKCIKLMKFSSLMIGGCYWVSERGFDIHINEDLKISSDKVNKKFYNPLDN